MRYAYFLYAITCKKVAKFYLPYKNFVPNNQQLTFK